MARKRQDIVGMLDDKVTKLREEESQKETELKELRQELKRYQLALDSLRGDVKVKRGRFKREKSNQLEEQ